MFRDQEEELQRLSGELRAEELEDEQAEALQEEVLPEDFLDSDTDFGVIDDGVYKNASNDYGRNLRNYANGYRAYNADAVETDLEEMSQTLLEEEPVEEKSLTGLIIAVMSLSAGIVAVLVYWLFRGGLL